MAETSEINRNLSALEEELKNIKSAAELITEARVVAVKTIEEAGNLKASSDKLNESTNELVTKIEKIDFPSRLDKMDSTISGINGGMQNIIASLDSVERHFEDSLKQVTGEVKSSADDLKNLINEMNLRLMQNNKVFLILNIAIIVLLLILIAIPFVIKP